MAITSLNELWGKKWVLAENPTVMGGDYGQSYLKLNPVPSEPIHIAVYNYNYFNSDELYVEASTGNFLTFWGKHATIHAYGIPWESSTVTSFIIRTSTVWVEPKGATPRLMEFIDQPSGYSFEENDLIVEFWNNNFVEVDEVVIDVKEEYEKLFESIGNSIRNKTGGSSKIYPTSIPAEIGKIGNSGATGTITITTNGTHDVAAYATANVNVPIPDGYIIPTGTLEITANGSYDAAEYASVNVAVEGGGSNGPSFTDFVVSRGIDIQHLFSSSTLENLDEYIALLDTSKVTNMTSLFDGCSNLVSVSYFDTSKVNTTNYMFCQNKNLETLFDMTVADYTRANSMFAGCQKLPSIKISSTGTHGFSNISYLCQDCYKMHTIDLYSIDDCTRTTTTNYAFSGCKSLTKLIIRNMTQAPTLNTNTFNNAYHFTGATDSTYNPDGLKDGRIYVPDAMVDTLKAATNWSTYADCIVPLSTLEE